MKEKIERLMMLEGIERDYGTAHKLLGDILPDVKYEEVVSRVRELGFANYLAFEDALMDQDADALYDLLYTNDVEESAGHNARARQNAFDRLRLPKSKEQQEKEKADFEEAMRKAEEALRKSLADDDQLDEYGTDQRPYVAPHVAKKQANAAAGIDNTPYKGASNPKAPSSVRGTTMGPGQTTQTKSANATQADADNDREELKRLAGITHQNQNKTHQNQATTQAIAGQK